VYGDDDNDSDDDDDDNSNNVNNSICVHSRAGSTARVPYSKPAHENK